MKHVHSDEWNNLREKAEKILKDQVDRTDVIGREQIMDIVHEMDVQRIELEIQNEELREAQKQLESTRNRYTHMFNDAPVGYVVLDQNAIVRQCNRTMARMAETDHSQIIDKPFTDLVHPESHQLFRSRFRSFSKAPMGKHIDMKFKVGEKHSFIGRMATMKSSSDTAIDLRVFPEGHMLVTVIDISDQKMAEIAITEQRDYLATTINSVADAVLSTDNKGRIIRINKVAEDLTEWSEADAVSETVDSVLKLVHTKTGAAVENIIEALNPDSETGFVEKSLTLVSKNGKRYQVSGHAAPIISKPRGILGHVVVLRDITDDFRLLEQRRFQATLLGNISDIVFAFSSDGTIYYANEPFSRLTGLELLADTQINVSNITLAPDQKGLFKQVIKDISSSNSWRGTLQIVDRNREIRAIETRINDFCVDDGARQGFIATGTDQTEKKILEQRLFQSQRIESIGRLAGGVAHDFNNMLSPIIGYTEMLLEEIDADNESFGPLQEILRGAERSRDLVKQLLAFSRKQTLRIQSVDLWDVVQKTTTFLRRTIPENIRLDVQQSSVNSHVDADPVQLEQVLMNLLVNAKDAMPGGGALNIEVGYAVIDNQFCEDRPEFMPGEYGVLKVADTGKGMSSETQKNLFEPFFSTKGELGTGLGLATVYGIVKQHQGNILVNSEEGIGTTFWVYLPSTAPVIRVDDASKKAQRRISDLSVLLVEDNIQVRRMILKVLKNRGYKVTPASSGEEALKILNKGVEKFSILLTDIIMPGINGLELHKHVCKVQPEIKVLFMSGYSGDVVDGIGSDNFIQKPFSLGLLLDKINSVMDN